MGMGGGLVLVLLAPCCGEVLWVPRQMRYSPPGQAQGPLIHPTPPLVPTGRRALPFPYLVGKIHQAIGRAMSGSHIQLLLEFRLISCQAACRLGSRDFHKIWLAWLHTLLRKKLV